MASNTPIPDLPKWTFLGGDGRLARRVGKPVRRFLHVEASGGVVLLLAAIAALIWANSPWSDSYYNFWHTDFELVIGSYHMGGESHHLTLETLVNDALMAIFFFVVGLEIKRELVSGQLKSPRAAALPVIAAIGGMIFQLLYLWLLIQVAMLLLDGGYQWLQILHSLLASYLYLATR